MPYSLPNYWYNKLFFTLKKTLFTVVLRQGNLLLHQTNHVNLSPGEDSRCLLVRSVTRINRSKHNVISLQPTVYNS